MSEHTLWGWIPNLSGDLDFDYVKKQISKYFNGDLKNYTLDEYNTTVIIDSEIGDIKIKICDEKGLCSITFDGDFYERQFLANIVWMNFRNMLDSCSNNMCDCTAMDQLVEAHPDDVIPKIAQKFVDTMEFISDTGTYIPDRTQEKINKFKIGKSKMDRWTKKMNLTITMYNLASINQIYGVRFLEIYSDKLDSETRSAFKKIMNARCQKAETIYGGERRLLEVEFKSASFINSTKMYIVTVFALGVAIVAILTRYLP